MSHQGKGAGEGVRNCPQTNRVLLIPVANIFSDLRHHLLPGWHTIRNSKGGGILWATSMGGSSEFQGPLKKATSLSPSERAAYLSVHEGVPCFGPRRQYPTLIPVYEDYHATFPRVLRSYDEGRESRTPPLRTKSAVHMTKSA